MPKESVEQVMTIPLRSGWSGPRQDRASHAIKRIRKHVSKHLKNPDADGEGRTVPWKEVWIDTAVNAVVWARGQQHIPHFIKVKAILFEDGEIRVELAGKEEEDEEKEAKRAKGKRGAKKPGPKKAEKEKTSEPKETSNAEARDGKKAEKVEKVPARPAAAASTAAEGKPKELKKTVPAPEKREEKRSEKKADTKASKKPPVADSPKSQSPKKG